MNLMILHLSDIHLKTGKNEIILKTEKLFDTIKNGAFENKEIFILCTGDIAYKGTEDEYLLAIDFFESLKSKITSYAKANVHFIFVPGNHDCYFDDKKEKARESIIASINSNPETFPDKNIVENLTECQKGFMDFSEAFHSNEKIIYDNKLLKIFKYEYAGKIITFNAFNTAWMSEKKEKYGKIFFPLKEIEDSKENCKSNLSISLFHHNFCWQNHNSSRNFKEYTENMSDIIITGHEHCYSSEKREKNGYSNVEHIEAGVLQSNNKNESSFNIIEINLEEEKIRIKNFSWNDFDYELNKNSEWSDFKRNVNIIKNQFLISEKMMAFLEEPGAQYHHPIIKKLTLNHIFIDPSLRLNSSKKKKSNGTEIIEKLNDISFMGNSEKYLFLGMEKAGKTSICKRIFMKYFQSGIISIMLNGHEIKVTKDEDIEKLIKKKFIEQYSENHYEKYLKLDKNKIVIIIDNFDKSQINSKGKREFIKILDKKYTNIIITASELFMVEEIMSEEKDELIINSYKKYNLLEFGHELRYLLINHWNLIGREFEIDKKELHTKNQYAQGIINSMVENNVVPSFPFFILTALQAIESGNPNRLEDSAHGYFYECLITVALSKITKNHDEVDAFYSYLTELAFHFYTKDYLYIENENFEEFHNWFCKDEYEVSVNLKKIVSYEILKENLINAEFLNCESGGYKFKYKYIYFYFVARYFSINIDKEDIREEIKEICRKVYRTEYANIIIFLNHHKQSKFVIDEIMKNSREVLKEVEYIKLDTDIIKLNSILTNIPQYIVEEQKMISIDENIKKHNINKDKIERKFSQPDDDEFNEDEEGLNLSKQLNLAFKNIEIIGQILKNYHTSLKGKDRTELGEVAYLLGLRALGLFFNLLEENVDYIIEELKRNISAKFSTSNKNNNYSKNKENILDFEKKEIAGKLLFNLCQMVAFLFMRRITDSLGNDKLSTTYTNILEKNNHNSIKLLDISIKLDHYKDIPIRSIEKMADEFKKNHMALELLKKVVVRHLYMFPTGIEDKQKLCSILNISIKKNMTMKRLDNKKI